MKSTRYSKLKDQLWLGSESKNISTTMLFVDTNDEQYVWAMAALKLLCFSLCFLNECC